MLPAEWGESDALGYRGSDRQQKRKACNQTDSQCPGVIGLATHAPLAMPTLALQEPLSTFGSLLGG
jgi:hypothetical protein